MENRNWKHYFRWSLGLHLVVLTALGLVLQQTMRPDLSTGPIRVKVEGFGPAGAPGAGKSGGSGGTAATENIPAPIGTPTALTANGTPSAAIRMTTRAGGAFAPCPTFGKPTRAIWTLSATPKPVC